MHIVAPRPGERFAQAIEHQRFEAFYQVASLLIPLVLLQQRLFGRGSVDS